MEIVEVSPADPRLPAVFGVMRELRDHLSEEEFNARYEAGHPDGYRLVRSVRPR